MHTAITAIPVGAGRQPLSTHIHSSTIDEADNSLASSPVPFAGNPPVARFPVLEEDLMAVTFPMVGLGLAQAPTFRRVKVTYKEVRIRPPVFKRVWTATFGRFERGEKVEYGAEPPVFVCQTPDRPTTLKAPPPLPCKGRKVQEDVVSEEMKEEFAAWVNARIVAAKLQVCL